MAEAFISRFRHACLVLVVLVSFGVVLTRLVHLHVLEQPELLEVVENSRHREVLIPARRGNIVDTRGNLLAFTRTLWEVGVDPVVAAEVSEADILKVAAVLRLEPDVALEAFEPVVRNGRARRWAKLAERVDKDQYETLLEMQIPGVYGNPQYVRNYPSGAHASHVLGYVNHQQVGVTGLEHTLDFYLKGQEGYRESERDGRRRELAQFRSREIQPRDGLNVELTLDQVIQDLAEEALHWAMETYKPKGATIIVSEPATGYLLALANAPDFDPNHYGKYPISHHRNIALTDIYEPGSTFKIVAASAALEENLVQPGDRFKTGLSAAEYRGRNVALPKDHHIYEELSMGEIVVKSSNRGAAFLGMMLGENRLYDYSRRFGFGEASDLGLPGEVNGILHPVKRWDGLTITRLPMGHAVSATPMQVHMAMSVMANDGILMEPQVVKRIFDETGDTLSFFHPKARRRVVSSETVRTMTGLLNLVVSDEGTAGKAQLNGFEVAGKTGTTQKIVNGRYSNRHHVASFSGFFPARQPRVVVTVIIDEPDFGATGYGGQVAAPVFQRLGAGIARYLSIEPVRDRMDTLVAWKGGKLGRSE